MDLGSVSGFWMNGRPSGLPENIEDQLAEAKRMQLVDPLQSEKDSTTSLKKAYTTLDTNISSLARAADALNSEALFTVRGAASSDETVATVSADSGAGIGTSSLDVTQLASRHTLIVGVDDGTADNGQTLGIGDPNDAGLIADGIDISFDHNGSTYSYTTAEGTTLNGIAQVVNTEENGVTAAVNNVGTDDAPEYVLVLKSETTGAGENRLTDTNGDPGIDISGSLFVDSGGTPLTNEVEEAQAGKNAEFTIDGVHFMRSSNTVDDVAQGLTIDLHGQGGAEIDVTQDYSGAAEKINAFVQAFNKAKDFIGTSTEYNPEDDSAGILLGSPLANNLEGKINDLVISKVDGMSGQSFEYLSQVGIQLQRDGSLSLDENALQDAFTQDPEAVAQLFSGENGVAQKMVDTLKAYTRSGDGALTYKIDSLENKLGSIDDQISDAQDEVQNYLERLVSKYTAMEQAVSQYKAMQDQLDSYAEQWSNMNSK